MTSGLGMSSCMTSTATSVTSEEEISSSTSSTLTSATTATEIELKPSARYVTHHVEFHLKNLFFEEAIIVRPNYVFAGEYHRSTIELLGPHGIIDLLDQITDY